jgi:hypothetical protein
MKHTMTTEKQMAKLKQVQDFYIFENGANGEKGGKPVGAAQKGQRLHSADRRRTLRAPKAKAPAQPEQLQQRAQGGGASGL